MDAQWIKAVTFAADKHKHQTRKGDGSSYICHPLRVAKILIDSFDLSMNTNTGRLCILGAILHDTVEDTNTTLLEIKENFGEDVMNVVADVTDDKSLPKLKRKKIQIQHAKTASRPAQLIKVADKIDNLRDLLKTPPKGWTFEDIRGYFLWSREVLKVIDMPISLGMIVQELMATEINGERLISQDEKINVQNLEKYYQNLVPIKYFWLITTRKGICDPDIGGITFKNEDMVKDYIDILYNSYKRYVPYPGSIHDIENVTYYTNEPKTNWLVIKKMRKINN